jgi:hypothetical protein
MVVAPSKEGPPDETIFAALGRLVYAFTQLEASLLNALVTALGDTDQAQVVTAGLSFNQALDRFSILYAELAETGDVGNVKDLCLVLSNLNDERNRHIHSNWGFWGSGQPLRARHRLRRNEGLAFTMESVRSEEVLHLAERMHEAASKVYELRRKYLDYRQVRIRRDSPVGGS